MLMLEINTHAVVVVVAVTVTWIEIYRIMFEADVASRIKLQTFCLNLRSVDRVILAKLNEI